ncbi:ABC transporter permease [Pontibacter sp. BT310]|uniref:Transport permease protein n=1 Tax=Pontibacter populi TaxID=890055 RepID=A0ABS6XAT7_9BACT|nr:MULTISPECIES: ABC transporter permease [Pontibacter]MBJ6118255.1 ABC transporter permease [Pontibacter sp. BT310]MBR0570682.1 ABC transporter permease [Microvirga sp. STS03]MBW3365108.1 ABC transporter permease [Pontibacter populi]
MPSTTNKWEWQIDKSTSFWSHSPKELWAYRFLLAGLIKRQFLLNYQQTILGPLWIFFQPILTLVTYVMVFNKLIGISTGNLPPVVFYASGIILWNFFSDSFTGSSGTFKENAHIFSKVYFPRIVMPVSIVSTHFIRFLMQLLLFLMVIIYYSLFSDLRLHLNIWILALPVSITFIGLMALGVGLLCSLLTAKYRDLTNLVTLGIRLVMFVTPVIYPVTAIPERLRWVVQINPLTPLFELFRLSLFGEGYVTVPQVFYSLGIIVLVLIGATLLFNKQCDKLIDVV